MQKYNANARKDTTEYIEKVIQIDRVNKVVKGGKRLSFRALVIVGDLNGKVGIALGKSREVPNAIRKGIDRAKKRLVDVNLVSGTIPHPVLGKYGASQVLLKPAREGTGVIAGGAVRVLLEAAGLKNIVAKSVASGNSINCAKAALSGLLQLKNLDQESKLRNKPLPVRLPVAIQEPVRIQSFSDDSKDKNERNSNKSAGKRREKSVKTTRPVSRKKDVQAEVGTSEGDNITDNLENKE